MLCVRIKKVMTCSRPDSIRSREKSHNRNLINIYARKQFRDDPSVRARSRRRISMLRENHVPWRIANPEMDNLNGAIDRVRCTDFVLKDRLDDRTSLLMNYSNKINNYSDFSLHPVYATDGFFAIQIRQVSNQPMPKTSAPRKYHNIHRHTFSLHLEWETRRLSMIAFSENPLRLLGRNSVYCWLVYSVRDVATR